MKIIKALYIALGTVFMLLGLLGIVLPLLPTTPLLLLTAYFYSKGSNRFHQWFISTWLYRRYLKDFVEKKGMTLAAKMKLLLFVDFMLMFPFFILDYRWVKPLVIILMITKYSYFFTAVKTIKKEESLLEKANKKIKTA